MTTSTPGLSVELLSTPTPRQLFVLLHDAGGEAADMLALGNLLGDAFPEAAVLMPDLTPEGLHDVAALAAWVRAQQQRFGLLRVTKYLLSMEKATMV